METPVQAMQSSTLSVVQIEALARVIFSAIQDSPCYAVTREDVEQQRACFNRRAMEVGAAGDRSGPVRQAIAGVPGCCRES